MAWITITDKNSASIGWEYDNNPPNPGGGLTDLWQDQTSGIRTTPFGNEIYTNCRKIGETIQSYPNEISKTYWDNNEI